MPYLTPSSSHAGYIGITGAVLTLALLAGGLPAELNRLQPVAHAIAEYHGSGRCPGMPHPHEPHGFMRMAENDAGSVPGFPPGEAGLAGYWWVYPPDTRSFSSRVDSSGCGSPGRVFVTRFPAGLPSGTGPVTFGGWARDGTAWKELRAVYLSMWIKIAGKDFENQRAGTKAGFIAVGRADRGQNEVYLWLENGTGAQRLQSRFRLMLMQQGIPQLNGRTSRRLPANVQRQESVSAGQWHHWELVLTLNDIGYHNGIARIWVDGRLVLDYSDVVYVTSETPRGFNGFKWNPTWGGAGGVRTRDDEILIDDVYISGIPYSR